MNQLYTFNCVGVASVLETWLGMVLTVDLTSVRLKTPALGKRAKSVVFLIADYTF